MDQYTLVHIQGNPPVANFGKFQLPDKTSPLSSMWLVLGKTPRLHISQKHPTQPVSRPWIGTLWGPGLLGDLSQDCVATNSASQG